MPSARGGQAKRVQPGPEAHNQTTTHARREGWGVDEVGAEGEHEEHPTPSGGN